jgi:hypothetical protein
MSDFEGHARITREAVRRRRGGSASGDRSGLARLPFLVPLRDVADVICSSGSCAEHHFMRHGPSEDPRRAFADSVAFIGECARRAEGGRDLWALAGAAHCLQDSFSGGHVLREGLGPGRPGTILHVKVYRGLERRGHAEGDRGWSKEGGGFTVPGELAVAATEAMLALVLDGGGVGWPAFAQAWLAPDHELGDHGDWRALDLIERRMTRVDLLLVEPGFLDEEGLAADLAALADEDPSLVGSVLTKLDELSPRNAAQTAALIQFLWRNSPRSSGPGSRRGRRDLGELQARGR